MPPKGNVNRRTVNRPIENRLGSATPLFKSGEKNPTITEEVEITAGSVKYSKTLEGKDLQLLSDLYSRLGPEAFVQRMTKDGYPETDIKKLMENLSNKLPH